MNWVMLDGPTSGSTSGGSCGGCSTWRDPNGSCPGYQEQNPLRGVCSLSSQGYYDFVLCAYLFKTMSLLAFLLRSPNDALKSFTQWIPEHVVRLLKDCPPELSAARKEFLLLNCS